MISILQSGQNIITRGLVLNFDASQLRSYPASGTTVNGLSASAVIGTLVNGVGFNSSNGGSFNFDGSNDYISIPNNTIGNLINGATASTFSIWLNNDVLPSVGVQNYQSIGFRINNVNSIVCTFFGSNIRVGGRSTSGDAFQETTTAFATTGTWVNITGVLDYTGDIVEIYVNGALGISTSVAFGSNTYVHTSAGVVDSIGRSATGVNPFDGKISIVQVYNVKLTATEILQNFNANRSRYGL